MPCDLGRGLWVVFTVFFSEWFADFCIVSCNLRLCKCFFLLGPEFFAILILLYEARDVSRKVFWLYFCRILHETESLLWEQVVVLISRARRQIVLGFPDKRGVSHVGEPLQEVIKILVCSIIDIIDATGLVQPIHRSFDTVVATACDQYPDQVAKVCLELVASDCFNSFSRCEFV